jgi:hypothetical protein
MRFTRAKYNRVVIRALAIALCATALAAGCGGSDEPSWNPESLGPNAGSRVDDFNAYAGDVDEPWERSAALLAGEFLRLDRALATRTVIDTEAPGEGTGPATATVTLDGVLDDSVRSERYVLSLARDGDVWRLESAVWAQRCRPGRGHEDYSAEPCI